MVPTKQFLFQRVPNEYCIEADNLKECHVNTDLDVRQQDMNPIEFWNLLNCVIVFPLLQKGSNSRMLKTKQSSVTVSGTLNAQLLTDAF